MNTLILIASLSIVSICQAGSHWKFKDKESIQSNYQFKQHSSDNTLYVHNMNGSVEIEGYAGDTIQVDIEKTLFAKSEENLQLAKNETWFKVVNENNQIHMFMKTPYSKLEFKEGEYHFRENNNTQKYRYKMNYKIKVPKDTNLSIFAVNDGSIEINDVQPQLIYAKNINGEIYLDKVSGEMEIATVNGDIALTYLDKNIQNGRFKSVNGTFTIQFAEKPDVEISYKTLNGHMYTAFDPTDVSSVMQKQYKGKKQGIKFKLKEKKVVRIGNGAHKFYFKTVNGDINIAKKV